jgi:ribonuclease BN (tRNA processing enzyme)
MMTLSLLVAVHAARSCFLTYHSVGLLAHARQAGAACHAQRTKTCQGRLASGARRDMIELSEEEDRMKTLVASLLLGSLGVAIAADRVAAQNAPARRTQLITLGTAGGPLPRADRAQSSNLLVVNGALYLIDAGGSVTSRVAQSGQDFRRIGKIFITHPHSDHTAGLATLMVSQWEYQRAEPTDIYGGGVEALVKGALAYLTPNAEIRWAEGKLRPMADTFKGHDVAAGVIYQDANVKVTAVENSHFQFQPGTPPYGKYKSFSYRFDTADRSFLFTGDTGWSDAVVDLAKNADVLVTEVTDTDDVIALMKRNGAWQAKTASEQEGWLRHMHEEHVTPEEVGKLAAKAGVKTIVMTHLSPSPDPNGDFAHYAAAAKKHFSGEVLVAKDLMKF